MKKLQHRFIWWPLFGIIWLVINIRVEAGLGSPAERTLDGLVSGTFLLLVCYYSFLFFGCFCSGQDCGTHME